MKFLSLYHTLSVDKPQLSFKMDGFDLEQFLVKAVFSIKVIYLPIINISSHVPIKLVMGQYSAVLAPTLH